MALDSVTANHYLADLDADMASLPIKDGDTVYSYESQTLYICDAGSFVPAVPAVPPGGSLSIYEAEIDFGSKPVESATFTVTDALVAVTHKILVLPSSSPATGRVGDDYSWENISYSALAGTGNFTLSAVCGNGSVIGKRKINYTFA